MHRCTSFDGRGFFHPGRAVGEILVALAGVAALVGCDREPVAETPPDDLTAASAPIFRDVTEEVGVDFVHVTGATGQYYFPEIMGAGVAVFDYDADGDLDIYLLQGGSLTPGDRPGPSEPNRLYRNDLVVGPDGTNTTFFFADTSRDLDEWPNFFGTSASAPHVAGVGALMLEANPALSPGDIYAALEGTALNMNPRAEGPPEDLDGFDFDTGYGFVQADLAVDAVATTGSGNSAPVANNDSASTKAGTAVVIDVLANDTDPDGDILSVAVVDTEGTSGSVTINVVDNTVTYEPLSGFTGTDSFKYQASDGALVSNQATVLVNVKKKGKGGGGGCNPKSPKCNSAPAAGGHAQWGQLVSGHGGTEVYERRLGGGRKVITFVTWTLEHADSHEH